MKLNGANLRPQRNIFGTGVPCWQTWPVCQVSSWSSCGTWSLVKTMNFLRARMMWPCRCLYVCRLAMAQGLQGGWRSRNVRRAWDAWEMTPWWNGIKYQCHEHFTLWSSEWLSTPGRFNYIVTDVLIRWIWVSLSNSTQHLMFFEFLRVQWPWASVLTVDENEPDKMLPSRRDIIMTQNVSFYWNPANIKKKQTKKNKPTTKINKKQNKNSAPITLDGGKSV